MPRSSCRRGTPVTGGRGRRAVPQAGPDARRPLSRSPARLGLSAAHERGPRPPSRACHRAYSDGGINDSNPPWIAVPGFGTSCRRSSGGNDNIISFPMVTVIGEARNAYRRRIGTLIDSTSERLSSTVGIRTISLNLRRQHEQAAHATVRLEVYGDHQAIVEQERQ